VPEKTTHAMSRVGPAPENPQPEAPETPAAEDSPAEVSPAAPEAATTDPVTTDDSTTPAPESAPPVAADAESAAGGTESAVPAVAGTAGDAESAAGGSESAAPVSASVSASRSGARPRVMPRKLVFRIPGSAYVVVLFLFMSASFVAVASPLYTLVYLLPVGTAIWLFRTRTEVDADQLVIRRVLTRTVLPWSEVTSLRLADRAWIRAVRTDGSELALPTVRTKHLPALALISGGRLTDPTAPADS
jgi:hypothetical protein